MQIMFVQPQNSQLFMKPRYNLATSNYEQSNASAVGQSFSQPFLAQKDFLPISQKPRFLDANSRCCQPMTGVQPQYRRVVPAQRLFQGVPMHSAVPSSGQPHVGRGITHQVPKKKKKKKKKVLCV
eukprot:Platyproteum_vivax@DN12412_c0_g1_i1.p1